MEVDLLKKWNAHLLPLEPSKKFIELVLGKDPSRDIGAILREWHDEVVNSKEGVIRKNLDYLYRVQTAWGKEILCYFVKDSDTQEEFESDMKLAWDFLEECYDEKWWRKFCIQEFGTFSKGHLANGLTLEKSTLIIKAAIFRP